MTRGTSGFPGSSQPRKRASNRGADGGAGVRLADTPRTSRDRRGETRIPRRGVQLSLFDGPGANPPKSGNLAPAPFDAARQLHREAMALADAADQARREENAEAVEAALRAALERESKAAALAEEPSRSVLLGSAASLAEELARTSETEKPEARPEPPPGVSDVTGGHLNAIEGSRAVRGLSLVWTGREAESGARVCRSCFEADPGKARAALEGHGFTMVVFRGRSEHAARCRVCSVEVLGQCGENEAQRSTTRKAWIRARRGTHAQATP